MTMKTIANWIENHITLHDNSSPRDEQANFVTHGIAAAAAFGYLMFIISQKGRTANGIVYTSLIIFASSQLILFTSSALYHRVTGPISKRVCRILDHLNIYVLIWGTYAPVLLSTGTDKSVLLFAVLTFTLFAGSLFTISFWGKLKPLHVILYLLMGWSLVFIWDDIISSVPSTLFPFVIAGGITYTLGVVFYAIKRIPYGHAIWHLLCLLASAFFSIGFLLNFLS